MTESLSENFLSALRIAVGADKVSTDPADCLPYGYDNSRRVALPQALCFATAHEHVVVLVRACHQYRVPLTVRGCGTNTTGATVPVAGGVVLSLERMNRILKITPADRLAIVEPGVTNGELQTAVAAQGFFWAPDPTSGPYSTIGGNLACCAAGPRAVKYGTVRENTLGLTAVTGTGETLHTGVQTTKGVVGYDLTRLLLGSEGTLAIITEATLKLTPLPTARCSLRALYRDVSSAAQAVAAIMAQAETPSALEFMDGSALALAREHGKLNLSVEAGALLLIEADGNADSIEHSAEALSRAARNPGLLELKTAASAAEIETLWAARRALSPALRTLAPKKINEDVVVPVSRIPALIEGLQALAARHSVRIVNFGHAGNGNIHVNLLGNPDDDAELVRMQRCLDEAFSLVLELGGTLSGEHGIGLEKREFVGRELAPAALALMRQIKQAFDPHGILNPGKFLPDQ
ncbi:MAG: FAD-binding oxidoreductase [Nevskiales bacterium]